MGERQKSIVEGLAVELYLDPIAETLVRDFRDIIYQHGVNPVQGLMNDKPHVSLAVFPNVDAGKLIALVEDFSRSLAKFPFRLDAMGTFASLDNILFLYPVPTIRLLEIHREFHNLLDSAGFDPSSYYRPGRWVPHLTLEYNLTNEELNQAIQIFKEKFTTITGSFTQLGVVKFRPIEYLGHFDLKD